MKGRARAWLLAVTQVAVTAATLVLIVTFAGGRQLLASFDQVDPVWIGIGLLCVFVQTYWLAWRWKIVCDLRSSFSPSISVLFHQIGRSMIYGQLLPSSLAADAIRIVGTARVMTSREATYVVICDRLVGLVPLALLGVASLAVLVIRTGIEIDYRKSVAVAVVFLVFALSAVLAFIALLKVPILGRVLAAVRADVTLLRMSPGQAFRIFSLAFAAQIIAIFAFAAFLKAMSAGASLWSAMLVLPLAQVATMLPISVGGWGVREGTVAFCFNQLGADPVTGVAASILFGLSGPAVGTAIEAAQAATRLRNNEN